MRARHEHSSGRRRLTDPQWLMWARELQALAQNGLHFAQDPFDKERYAAVQRVAKEMLAAGSGIDRQEIDGLVGRQAGYATPKIDVRGAVFLDGRILLVRERSDGLWTLPGGWADVNESPAEGVEREIREESGYRATATKLVALWDRSRHDHPPHAFYIYKAVFLCELTAGHLQDSVESDDTVEGNAGYDNFETDGVGFFARDALPPLSIGRVTARQIHRLFEHLEHPELPADFD